MCCLFFCLLQNCCYWSKVSLPSHLKARLCLPLLNCDFCDLSHSIQSPGSTPLWQALSPSIAGHAFPCISHLMMEIPHLVGFAHKGRAFKCCWVWLTAIKSSIRKSAGFKRHGIRMAVEREEVRRWEVGTGTWCRIRKILLLLSGQHVCVVFHPFERMDSWLVTRHGMCEYAPWLFPVPTFFIFIAMYTWKAVNDLKNYLLLCVRGALECEQYFLSN